MCHLDCFPSTSLCLRKTGDRFEMYKTNQNHQFYINKQHLFVNRWMCSVTYVPLKIISEFLETVVTYNHLLMRLQRLCLHAISTTAWNCRPFSICYQKKNYENRKTLHMQKSQNSWHCSVIAAVATGLL